MRSLPALMEEIVTKSKGLSSNLALINLSDEAKRALKPVIGEFIQKGDIKSFDQFLNMSGDGTTTLNDAAVAASDFAASLQLVSNSWSQFANQQLAEPIAELADAINSLEPDAVQNWLETGKSIALVVGGLVAVKKGIDAVKWTKGVWDAAKPSKGGAGGMGGAMADLGATPVYVVNMPGGGMGGGAMGPGDMPGTEPGKGGKGSKVKSAFANVLAGSLLYPAVDYAAELAIGDTAFGKWAKSTTLGDVGSAAFNMLAPEGVTASPRPDNLSTSLDIRVMDDRISVRTRDAAPGTQVRVDNGPSLMP